MEQLTLAIQAALREQATRALQQEKDMQYGSAIAGAAIGLYDRAYGGVIFRA